MYNDSLGGSFNKKRAMSDELDDDDEPETLRPAPSSANQINASANESTVIFQRKKKVPKIRRSLAVLVSSLQGMGIVIELKNDVEVYGIVEEVDPTMTITLLSAREVFPNGTEKKSEVLHISGRAIRYVHIPPDINPTTHLMNYIKTVDRLNKSSRPHTIKDAPSNKKKVVVAEDFYDH